MQYEILRGDCLAVLKTIPDNTFDSVVCDPPYGLSAEPDMAEVLRHWLAGDDYQHKGGGFMGKTWDSFVPGPAVWREALRVLKPGGHLLAFFGTRTYDMGTLAIRLAGFQIRDSVAWVYASGMPKSLDVSKAIDKAAGAEREVVGARRKSGDIKGGSLHSGAESAGAGHQTIVEYTAPATDAARQWDGWGTALKPSHEPICVARKPLVGTVAANVLEFGTGALNIDGCRVATTDTYSYPNGRGGSAIHGGGQDCTATAESNPLGRWPANLCHDGSDEVLALFPQAPGQLAKASTSDTQRAGQNVYGDMARGSNGQEPRKENNTSAARFFMECKGSYNDVCPDQNPPLSDALIAALNSSRPSQAVDSVLAHAVSAELPAELHCSGLFPGPSTSATPTELRQLCESATQTILSTGKRFWLGSRPAKLTLSLNPANAVVQLEPTGTTTITISHWRSDGSAEPVTFNIMPQSSGAGAKGFVPFMGGSRLMYCAKASKSDRGPGNTHPTVKPLALMQYLCRLVTPPGGHVLDPFAGSGSTIVAALREGFRATGIELLDEHADIADARAATEATGGLL